VANTFRFEKDGTMEYYATLDAIQQQYVSPQFSTGRVVDKVGSGDCFMAALIYGLYNSLPPQEIIDFAAAAAFDKLFIRGDSTTSTIAEIKRHF
jgi:2-dehydro-3-deoxygluconokinase